MRILAWNIRQGGGSRFARIGEALARHKADILVMGDDWKGRFDIYKDLCEVVYLPRTKGISTTQVKEETVRKALQ